MLRLERIMNEKGKFYLTTAYYTQKKSNVKHKNTNKDIVLDLQFKKAGEDEDETYEI